MTREPRLLSADTWESYELLDSGDGRKLERFGAHTVIRPEPQVVWPAALGADAWDGADAHFQPDEGGRGGWRRATSAVPTSWEIHYAGVPFEVGFTNFRHLGVFPEQAVQWDWLAERIAAGQGTVRVLNLFAYTGVASLIAANAGARVTHLDASKKAITWANTNQARAGLNEAPIRWICDDALKFLRREARRGRTYDVIVLDPPKYGRGPKGEVWQLHEQLWELLTLSREVLARDGLGVVTTVYAIRMSSASLDTALGAAFGVSPAEREHGEMAVRDRAGRAVAAAAFARWPRGTR